MGLNLSFEVSIIRTYALITQVNTPSATYFAVNSCQCLSVFQQIIGTNKEYD